MGLLPKLHECMFAIEQTGFLGARSENNQYRILHQEKWK